MTEKVDTRPWGVATKPSGSWWAGEERLTTDPSKAATFPNKTEARQAFTDANGGKFPTAKWVTTQLPDAGTPTVTGGVTDKTPGQTERVAAALAKATAEAKVATTEPEATPGTDVAVDDALDAELVSTAAELDIEIRSTADRYTSLVISADNTWTELAELIEEAQHRNIHTDLGFASWPKYIADVVKKNLPQIGYDSVARQSLVGVLTGAGLSQRAQAEIVGVNQATISRDQQVMHDASPDATPIATVTSINGGTFTKPAPKPKPEPKQEPVAAQPQSATPKVDKLTAEVDAVIAEAQALAAKIDAISDAIEDRKLKIADGTYYHLEKNIKVAEGIVGEAFENLGSAVYEAC